MGRSADRRAALRENDIRMGRVFPPILAKRTSVDGESSGALKSSAGALDGSPARPVNRAASLAVKKRKK